MRMVTDLSIMTHNGDPINLSAFDRYGYFDFCVDVAKMLNEASSPLTVAIFGRWGSGKSSILITLEELLCQYPVFHYSPWKYRLCDFDSVLRTFLQSFGISHRLKNVGKQLIKTIASLFSADTNNLEGAISPQVNHFETARTEFHKVINAQLSEKVDRVFFFIDDLDRCEPEVSILVLRVIQVFCRVKNVIFVLAMDRNVIDSNLQQKYDKTYASEYLDKMIQLQLHCPLITYSEINNALVGNESRPELEPFTNWIAESLDFNPRKIERFIFLYDFQNILQSTTFSKNQDSMENYKKYLVSIDVLHKLAKIIVPAIEPRFSSDDKRFFEALVQLSKYDDPAVAEGLLTANRHDPELRRFAENPALNRLLRRWSKIAGKIMPRDENGAIAPLGIENMLRIKNYPSF
jgi:hypothetical protein